MSLAAIWTLWAQAMVNDVTEAYETNKAEPIIAGLHETLVVVLSQMLTSRQGVHR